MFGDMFAIFKCQAIVSFLSHKVGFAAVPLQLVKKINFLTGAVINRGFVWGLGSTRIS